MSLFNYLIDLGQAADIDKLRDALKAAIERIEVLEKRIHNIEGWIMYLDDKTDEEYE